MLRSVSDLSLLADEHYDGLLAYVRAKVKSPSIAADIVQESWLRAIAAMQDREIRNGRNYLFRTARNLLIDRQRLEKSRATWLSADVISEDLACDSPSPERHAIARQELDRIMAIIITMPPKCQAVFVMRRFDDMAPTEIAASLNIRRGTVEKHLRVALAHLLAHIDGD